MTVEFSKRCVKDEMTQTVVTVSPQDSILRAIHLMATHSVKALPVTDEENRCVGIVSTADLVDPQRWLKEGELSNTDLGNRDVADLMSADPRSVNAETSVLEAARQVIRHDIHHLPVVDENQQVVGIISTMDLLVAFYRYTNATV